MKNRPPKLIEQPDGRSFIWYRENGKRRKRYFGRTEDPDTRRAYEQWVRELRQAQAAPEPSHRMTIADLTLAFMDHAKSHYRKNGKQTSEVHAMRSALRPLNRLFGSTTVLSFGPRRIIEVRDEMIRLGWARTTINRAVVRIRTVFRWGIVRELVPAHIVTAIEQVQGLESGRTLARETEEVRPVSIPDLIATMRILRPVLRSMMLTQALTGMRPGELCQMTLGDIDRTGDVWLYRPKTHKLEHKRKKRIIPIGPRAQRHILRHCIASPDAPVFRTNRGTAFTSNGYRQAIQKPCQRHGINVWSPNQLRHLGATIMRRKASLEIARVALGHSSTRTTEIYAEQDLQSVTRFASSM